MRGRDIKRYGYNWDNIWLINAHNGVKNSIPRVNIEDYPAVKAHLNKFWDMISKRADKGDTPYNLRNCAYMEDFSQPKIIWGEISDKAKFFLDREGKFYCEATTFLLLGEQLEYLICYLNSRLAEFLFSIIGTTTGVGTIRWKKYKILDLMVPQIGDDSYLLIKRNYQKYEKENDAKYLLNIEKIIYDEFSLSSLEIDYIENRVKQSGE